MVHKASRVASPDQHALTVALVSAQKDMALRYERMLVMASQDEARNGRVRFVAHLERTVRLIVRSSAFIWTGWCRQLVLPFQTQGFEATQGCETFEVTADQLRLAPQLAE